MFALGRRPTVTRPPPASTTPQDWAAYAAGIADAGQPVTTFAVAVAASTPVDEVTRSLAIRIGTALRRAGWTLGQRGGGARARVYSRPHP